MPMNDIDLSNYRNNRVLFFEGANENAADKIQDNSSGEDNVINIDNGSISVFIINLTISGGNRGINVNGKTMLGVYESRIEGYKDIGIASWSNTVVDVKNIVVCILDRPRHQNIISLVRKTGARIKLITDGDVSAVIATTVEDSGVDIYLGSGGSPEGVLAAAALRCLGGKIYGKLLFQTDAEKQRASEMGINDFNKIYTTNDLASGEVMFAATGVTDGTLLKGVRIKDNIATTHSVLMRSKTQTVRYVYASHNLYIKPIVS